ncbi:aminoglycoside phosphotransferase [Actinoplanes sp. SE50]|uniref:phosphotransferase n=1 Tax=unclassified Actinoplanes TaxID=2626549 RepID=UPI00023EBB06|nr:MULTISPECIES: phosphotransferase [unclassified Actinoplanes]AEV82292.1 Protein kinase 3 [Actinoplanes sp. SE50/110]ATO80689.1 aminoglycoside phosphotransferase [Actinoplanes sp. SE50]SLL98096.1 aminoglycoside phosphotransferase [Actinoplanes sp. SE50/110]
MRPITLPDVPYSATAVRPQWHELPETVREAITERLGSPIVAARSAGGGFTRAFAAVLDTEAGTGAFVKAAPLSEPTSQWYAREAAVTSALPPEVTAARPIAMLTVSDWFVLCLEAVDGRIPELPWTRPDLDAALRTWSAAATALAYPSPALLAVGLPRLPDILRDEMSWWSLIAKRREPMPEPARDTIAPARLADLARLERALPDLAAGDHLLHGDLRLDNVLIDRDGRAWLCDWTWPCLGAPWFDTVTLLVSAYASGADTDAVLRAWGAPDDGVDGALAALAGYWLVRAGGGPSSASPHSRQHQRFSGRAALAWLAERRGWSATPPSTPGRPAPEKRGWLRR